jgi:hypothetical protein
MFFDGCVTSVLYAVSVSALRALRRGRGVGGTAGLDEAIGFLQAFGPAALRRRLTRDAH